MTTTSTPDFVIRKHFGVGWQLSWAVQPVINGWPQEPGELFDGETAARRHLHTLTTQTQEAHRG